MRKIVFTLATLLMWGGFAQAQSISNCGTDIQAKIDREQNPAAYDAAKAAFEANFRTYVAENAKNQNRTKAAPKYIIPVVFHVFHNNGSENLTDAQIASIITNLNKYYSGDPSVVGGVRPIFKDIIAQTNFEFRLAKLDPNGNCTNGIVRVQTQQTYKATQEIKKLSTWDTKRYLNIWSAANIYSGGSQVGGYAQFPYGDNSATTDGLLIDAQQSLAGNTVSHEIGHCMGLMHPFQGSESDSCTDGDGVFDTPPTWFISSSGGRVISRGDHCADATFNTCSTDNPDLPDQQENIMDYFDGSCSGVMFTLGQLERMQYCLTNYRHELWQDANLVRTGVNDGYTCTSKPIANFYMVTPGPKVCVGSNLSVRDDSYNGSVTTYDWQLGDGAVPATATTKTVTYNYSTPGWKTVTLTSTGPDGTSTITKKNFIYVEADGERTKLSSGVVFADWDYINDYQAKGWYFDNEVPANWVRTTNAFYDGNHSLMLNTPKLQQIFSYSLVSPTFDLTGATNPYITFKYAFAANFLGGSKETNDTRDGMQVFVSYDCGKNWQQKYVLQGAEGTTANLEKANPLTTTGSATQRTVPFTPVNQSQWGQMVSVSGGSIGTGAQLASVKFKISFTYRGGNNFYLDRLAVGASGTTGLNNLTAADVNLSVKPNPFNSTATIEYDLLEPEFVTVSLYDIVGKEIAVLHKGNQSTGNKAITISKDELGLTSGMYFVRTTLGNSSFSTKVMIN
jgi:PKD repeat protein